MKYNLVHKLFYVNTNVDRINYFLYAHWLDILIKGSSLYGVNFFVKKDLKRPNILTQKFDFFWGKKNSKLIYYEHPILPGIKAKLLLDMTSDVYSITVNEAYYNLSRYRFENVWPPGQHLTNLIIVKLLQSNILTLHSASFYDKKNKEGNLVMAISNTGKSYTIFAALKKGYQYHSEDLTVLDKEYIYTTPLISAQSSMLPDKNLSLKYNLFINKLTGINIFLPRIKTLETFHKLFSKQDVNFKSEIKKIFILEKGDDEVIALDKSEAFRKILILNRIELLYSKDQLLLAYSYFNNNLDMEKMIDKEKEIIRQIVDKAECFLIKSNFPERYLKLIEGNK